MSMSEHPYMDDGERAVDESLTRIERESRLRRMSRDHRTDDRDEGRANPDLYADDYGQDA